VNESTLDNYKNELSRLINKEKEISISKSHLYKLLKDPELSDDESIKIDYLKSKNDLELLSSEVAGLQNKILNLSVNQRQTRLDKIFGEFNYKMNFNQIKELIHSIVVAIKVKHSPEQRLFFVQVNYRGFDELSVFVADHKLMRWVNMTHTKTVPKTEEDKQRDDDLFDYLAAKTPWTRQQMIDALKKFESWEDKYENMNVSQLLDKVKKIPMEEEESVINIATDKVELLKEELYDFNNK
jgi:hypothetical protein